MNRWQRLSLAVILIGLSGFLAASILGWHPGDPPYGLILPGNPTPMNWCGWVGAGVAGYLVELFGSAAGFVVLAPVAASFGLFATGWKGRAACAGGVLLAL